jgi:pyruvate/2-oxoglutarate dehydrogenase complex dihydrolipoamide acyltransferase (E2) component
MSSPLHPLILPDLGLPDGTVVASGWLVEPGSSVVEGDRLLEVLAGSVTIDLPAPVSGILSEQLVSEDDELHVGQILAIVTASPPRDESA